MRQAAWPTPAWAAAQGLSVFAQVQERAQSADGYEVNFATNTLGTFVLTHQLQRCLRESGPGSRVVTVASGGAYTAPLVHDDLQMEQSTFDGMQQYARDKRRQIAMMERFAAILGRDGIGCYTMHPGWVDTEGVAVAMPGFYKSFAGQLRSLQQGADTVLWLALADMAQLEPGALYLDRAVQHKHMFMAGTAYKPDAVDALWERLLELADLKGAEGAGKNGSSAGENHEAEKVAAPEVTPPSGM